jgi:transposase
MIYIQGKDRTQSVLFPKTLDQLVNQDHEVRFIDLFVESININDYEFKIKTKTLEGRPPYNPKDLLKLYIYGYLNSIRSSRVLEKETQRNIEVMWLLKQLSPDHNTISNFRRDNEKAIRKVFQKTVSIAKEFKLIGGQLLAGDSTKLRAQNSKKNNFNEKKITQHIEYIDNRLNEYNAALELADTENKKLIQDKIDLQKTRKTAYLDLQKTLEETGEKQISTSDPESRQLITRNNITEVAYSIQTVVDAQHNIPIDYLVTNENDSKAMGEMLERTNTIIPVKDTTILYDKGYHTGSEIKKAIEMEINIMVAIPAVAAHAPDHAYDVEHFIYDNENDHYTCPEQQQLITNGSQYKKQNGVASINIKQYKTRACVDCPAFAKCTTNKRGRLIERSEYEPYIEQNKINIEANKEIYKQRQCIVEHPYGILKRQWGFYYIMTKKGKQRASADVGLMFVAYNLRRLFNIIDKNEFKKYLENLVLYFFAISPLHKSYLPKLRTSFSKQIPVADFYKAA